MRNDQIPTSNIHISHFYYIARHATNSPNLRPIQRAERFRHFNHRICAYHQKYQHLAYRASNNGPNAGSTRPNKRSHSAITNNSDKKTNQLRFTQINNEREINLPPHSSSMQLPYKHMITHSPQRLITSCRPCHPFLDDHVRQLLSFLLAIRQQ